MLQGFVYITSLSILGNKEALKPRKAEDRMNVSEKISSAGARKVVLKTRVATDFIPSFHRLRVASSNDDACVWPCASIDSKGVLFAMMNAMQAAISSARLFSNA
jgi:hypothetical protein